MVSIFEPGGRVGGLRGRMGLGWGQNGLRRGSVSLGEVELGEDELRKGFPVTDVAVLRMRL